MQKLSAGKFHFEPPSQLSLFDHLVSAHGGRGHVFLRPRGTVFSPLPVALVEGRRRAQPGTPNTLGARKAKVLHQVNQALAQSKIRRRPVDRFYARHFNLRQERCRSFGRPHRRRLLRMCCKRPCRSHASEQADEVAPPHSITSSARASSVGGISRPMAFAALRLIVSSNFVGCSIGRSAGLAPCKIRLTYQAPRLNKSDRDVPYDIRPPAFTFSFVWYIAGKRCFSMKPIISPMCRWIRRSFVVANAFGFLCIIAANAGSSASLVRIGTEINCRPSAGTAMINSSRKARFESLSGFHRKATRARPGTQSFKTSSRLPMRSGPRMVLPVIFRSGRARFVAKPALTGSPIASMTIGTVDVACRAARVAGEPYVTMTFTGSEASSRAA